MIQQSQTGQRFARRPIGVIGAVGALVLGLSACSGAAAGGGQLSPDGISVPYDATVEEWQAAFADVEPIDIVFQTATSATSPGGTRQAELVERIAAKSDGKLQVELIFGDALVGEVESDEGLVDGRLDLHLVVTPLQPDDFPITGVVQPEASALRGSSVEVGSFALQGAANEIAFQTPELLAEIEDKGMKVITPLTPAGNIVIACSQQLTSFADLAGKQIRAASPAQFAQIEAIGATPVSVAFQDLYESVQRGIVDCITVQATTLLTLQMADLVPYLMSPVGTSFSGTTATEVAGAKWDELPLQAQQLIFDSISQLDMEGVFIQAHSELNVVLEEVEAAGGGFFNLDADVSTTLGEHNEKVAAYWADSKLFDGENYASSFVKIQDEWSEALGDVYSDQEFADFPDTYSPDLDPQAFYDLYAERVIIPNRPS